MRPTAVCKTNCVRASKTKSGDNSAEETPVPISNTAVKLRSADDTWREAARESRSLPVLVKKKLHNGVASFFLALASKTGQLKNRYVLNDEPWEDVHFAKLELQCKMRCLGK